MSSIPDTTFVTPERPCPVCGGHSGCIVYSRGSVYCVNFAHAGATRRVHKAPPFVHMFEDGECQCGVPHALPAAWKEALRQAEAGVIPFPARQNRNGSTAGEDPGTAAATRTFAELLEDTIPEPAWAVPGLIPEGLSLLVGPPKSGKSFLALGAIAAVVRGGRAFDFADCEAGGALYLYLEGGLRDLQERVSRVVSDGHTQGHFATEWPRFDDGGLDRLEEWLTAHPGTRLVVIDTLLHVRPLQRAGGSVYQQDYQALAPVGALAHKHHTAIVCLHHTRKMDSDEPLDLVSGSNGLAGAADAILLLKREGLGDGAMLTIKARTFEPRQLAMTFDGSTYLWAIKGTVDTVEKEMAKRTRVKNALIKAGRALTTAEIAELSGLENDGNLRRVLSTLAHCAEIVRVDRGTFKIRDED